MQSQPLNAPPIGLLNQLFADKDKFMTLVFFIIALFALIFKFVPVKSADVASASMFLGSFFLLLTMNVKRITSLSFTDNNLIFSIILFALLGAIIWNLVDVVMMDKKIRRQAEIMKDVDTNKAADVKSGIANKPDYKKFNDMHIATSFLVFFAITALCFIQVKNVPINNWVMTGFGLVIVCLSILSGFMYYIVSQLITDG